jgi:gluconolactonase
MLGIGGIIEYDPRGVILGYVPLPNGDSAGTNFAFGGPDPGLIGPGGVRLPAQR